MPSHSSRVSALSTSKFLVTPCVSDLRYPSHMKLKHYDDDGRYRFITFAAHDRVPIFTNPRLCAICIDWIEHICDCCAVEILAYVIMPEHVHIVLLPPPGVPVGQLIGEIKKNIARDVHAALPLDSPVLGRLVAIRNGREKFALWQRRCFDHNCRTEESAQEKVNYCHWNPVTRGLVMRPEDYEWSSYNYIHPGVGLLFRGGPQGNCSDRLP
jgi:putative transposase